MGRKCSHCGKTGHNSRTCNTMRRQVLGCRFRLFGVHVNEPPLSINNHNNLMKTMDRLNCNASPSSSSSSSSSTSRLSSTITSVVHHQISNKSGLLNLARAQERKKGVAWSEEEHMMFLIGLEKLGKGDWRGISRNFVTTRTPTQVASHAQKYFLKRNSLFPTATSNRRHSLFDMGRVRHQFTHEMLKYYNVLNLGFGSANNKTTTILPTTTTSLTGLTKLDTTTGNLMDYYYSSNQCPILRTNHHQYKPIFNREYSLLLHNNNNNSLQPNITSSCYSNSTTAKITSFQSSDHGISASQPNLELTLSAPTPQLGQHGLHRLIIT